MTDFGAPIQPASGADPYAGLTDSEVITANTSGYDDKGNLHIGVHKMNANTQAALAQQYRDEAKKGTVESTAPQDFGAPAITKDFTNDQILGTLGYSNDDITKLKDDPAYKAMERLDGKDFLAKDVASPGTLVDAMRKIPSIGAFLHGANESAFGVAQLLAHGAHQIGAVPDTTPALFDALAKFNALEYQQGSGVKPDEYTVPKILGGVAAGMATGGAGVAGGAASAPATALMSGIRVAKALGGAAAGGAVAAPAMTPATAGPSEVSQAARDAFWQQKGEDAKQGAMWALGLHGLMKTMFAAGLHVGNKIEVAARIKNIIGKVRQGAPQGSTEYQKIQDELTPLFNNPEYAERELQFAANKVSPTVGDVTQTGFATKTERAARSMPFGLGKFRHDVQQPQLQAAGQAITSEAFDRMINTKWGGRIELEKAAKGTGRHAEDARKVLELMDSAGTDAAKILQAGGKAENIRKLLIKEKLYKARDDLAGRAALPPKLPLEAANTILRNARHASAPNTGFMGDIGRYATALSDPAMPKTYASFQRDIHNVESLVKKYGADTHEGQELLDLKKAYEQTLRDFTNNVQKYAKAERYGLTAAKAKPAFVTSAGGGGGYTFDNLIRTGEEIEPGIQRYVTRKPNLLKYGKEEPEVRKLRIKSPLIIEGEKGMAELKKAAHIPDDIDAEQLEDAVTQYAKTQGHDAVVFTKEGVPKQLIDLTKWKKSIGDAEARAAKYYKETYRPAIDSGTVQAMRTSTPDEIFNQFIQKGKENRAQNFFNSLDAKGQASIQYELIKRSVAAGTDADGNINPGKVADYLFKNKEAGGVFFKGEQKWALDGFLKLMQHSREASPNTHGGGHGAMSGFFVADAFLDVIRGIVEGNAHKAVKGAVASAAGLAGAGKVLASVATNLKLRHYMLAASDAAVGSPTMDKIYQKFTQALTLAIGKSVGETGGDVPND